MNASTEGKAGATHWTIARHPIPKDNGHFRIPPEAWSMVHPFALSPDWYESYWYGEPRGTKKVGAWACISRFLGAAAFECRQLAATFWRELRQGSVL